MADSRDSRVVLELEDEPVLHTVFLGELLLDGFGVDVHGTELVHRKRLAVDAYALLPEEDGAAIFVLDQQRDDQHDRRTDDDRDEREEDVAQALEYSRDGGVLRELRGEHRHQGIAAEVELRGAQVGQRRGLRELDAHGFHGER